MLVKKSLKHTVDVGQQRGERGVLALLGDAVLERGADHGVLAHQQLALAAEVVTDVLHLAGADVISMHDENLGVLGKEIIDPLGVGAFLDKGGTVRHG